MVITILREKYKCNCKRGLSKVSDEGLLRKLNSIIEWDLCSFPKIKDSDENKVEDRKFLGDNPELKPGDCFLYKTGQVIAVDDENSLVLVLSESGVLALKRICEEVINAEYELLDNNSEGVTINFEEEEKPESDYVPYRIPYYRTEIFKNRVIKNKYKDNFCFKIELASDFFIMPIHLYLTDKDLYINSNEVDPNEHDIIDFIITEIYSWFIKSDKK